MNSLFDVSPRWTFANDQLNAHFATGDFATGVKFINRIAASAEEANHHPDLLLSYSFVEITLTSHDVGHVTERDISLARIIDAHADALQIKAEA
ncbi:4a-hydroxytetrahydrobiopterin dehydratase [Corynebacterium crudilactis]|uniref:Putative pterin-4-alpha-carbinolamine dehydratase n=1 Tax=Corynebacterium crudilactis TaxID=1652495 RepID=A0A172QR54_9CORY|nr:4a-hydroxytetrahydrobiopterin dehydratase [Corynebacterium crudilactis]ANE03177.1 pterin-4-alpha-carbinolamine dehydratase [Corynebacterium crudilactis]